MDYSRTNEFGQGGGETEAIHDTAAPADATDAIDAAVSTTGNEPNLQLDEDEMSSATSKQQGEGGQQGKEVEVEVEVDEVHQD